MYKNIKFIKIFSLFRFISTKRKKQSLILLLFACFSGFVECLTVYSIIPFINIFTGEFSELKNIFSVTYNLLFKDSSINFSIYASFTFLIIFSMATFCKISCLYLIGKLSAVVGSELGNKAYRATININFIDFMTSDKNSFISDQVYKVHYLIEFILVPFFNTFYNLISILCIIIILFISNPNITIILTILLFLSYLLISYVVNRKITKNSSTLITNQEILIKLIRESISSIRIILLKNYQNFFSKRQYKIDLSMRKSYVSNVFLSTFPRYIIEWFGIFILIISSIIIVSSKMNSLDFISTIGLFAFAAQRMLPSMQNLYNGFTNIKAYESSLDRILSILRNESNYKNESTTNNEVKNKSVTLKSVKFSNVLFEYEKEKKALKKKINLEIYKGDFVGIFGETGSGKSTFIDLLLGFLKPNSGQIFYNNKNINLKNNNLFKNQVQNKISHVPHSVFISDDSIKSNIAFGKKNEDIDSDKILKVLEIVKMQNRIQGTHAKLDLLIGEDGVKLSTGQKQRIGIARALYDDFEILILDEATSSLDIKTELIILEKIYEVFGSNCMIIIISHRRDSLKLCNKIIDYNKKFITLHKNKTNN